MNSAELIIPIKDNLLLISGYFFNDPLNLSRIGGTLEQKKYEIMIHSKS